jgi:hypothetical protein
MQALISFGGNVNKLRLIERAARETPFWSYILKKVAEVYGAEKPHKYVIGIALQVYVRQLSGGSHEYTTSVGDYGKCKVDWYARNFERKLMDTITQETALRNYHIYKRALWNHSRQKASKQTGSISKHSSKNNTPST